METISNIAGAASKAIWGESQTEGGGGEPVSGEQGAGTKSAPFDQGNDRDTTTTTTAVDDNAGAKSGSTAPAPADTVGANPGNTGSSGTGSGSTSTAPPQNDAPVSGIDSNKDKHGPSEAQSGDTTGDPSSAPAPEGKQQGADKPREQPPTEKDGRPSVPHTDSQREALVNSGKEFPRDPNDHSGEPLKMHDGPGESKEKRDDPREDAGDKAEGGTKPRSASVSQEGGDPHGGNKGTGEEYVKSSGLAADGGDFDATNPGAGAEATRLQEEKGITKEKPAAGQPAEASPSPSGDKPKVSKLQKLKDKLHIGGGKDPLDK